MIEPNLKRFTVIDQIRAVEHWAALNWQRTGRFNRGPMEFNRLISLF
jgi:hypothetical protein